MSEKAVFKKMLPWWLITLLALLISLALLPKRNPTEQPAMQQESATLLSVFDGDTLEVKTQDGFIRIIELAYIDAPEREQPYGREAIAYLKHHVLGQPILMRNIKETQEVFFQGVNINFEMTTQGLAWINEEAFHFPDFEFYQQAQEKASLQGIGLWGLDHKLRIRPKQWRQQAKEPMAGKVFKPHENQSKIFREFRDGNRKSAPSPF